MDYEKDDRSLPYPSGATLSASDRTRREQPLFNKIERGFSLHLKRVTIVADKHRPKPDCWIWNVPHFK